eukprot:CAMPEP_0172455644 /NCGR_PEP_ID=MMETSP1065-20121228/12171_1 /TAXON_ID=265537 /ORGANISM="Amphiprora paludosa, Strain CCMP125" /LENGTH=1266 /DNA_ID=CAMNT_0013208113 /DNA_START=42 /DNA_END=3842 /DNA_ORIENTATION=-
MAPNSRMAELGAMRRIATIFVLLSVWSPSCSAKNWLPTPTFRSSSIQNHGDRRSWLVRNRGGEVSDAKEPASEPYYMGLHSVPHDLTNDGPAPTTEQVSLEEKEEDDDERYSRQVYTLGKRAHSLIRSTTVYLDAPLESGLLYEIAKNLALSGVHQLVLVIRNKQSANPQYHAPHLDDLGGAYIHAATRECKSDEEGEEAPPLETLLLEYVKRLNPAVQVKSWIMDESESETFLGQSSESGPAVYMALDRPASIVQDLNDWVRKAGDDTVENGRVKFVSVETAGVYGQIFVDLGPEFCVHDSDGEMPARVPLLEVKKKSEEDDKDPYNFVVHCMPGEKHDVSKGDFLEFHLRNGDTLTEEIECIVQRVISPFQVQVQIKGAAQSDSTDDESLLQLLKQSVSFSRIKQSHIMSFVPYKEALEKRKIEGGLITPSDLDKSFDSERQDAVLACFAGLDLFAKEHGRLPGNEDSGDVAKMKDVVSSILMHDGTDGTEAGDDSSSKLRKKLRKRISPLVKKFVRSCAAKFTPLQGVMGAIAAQEALKAASGLYTPIHQFLLFDCDEVLVDLKEGKSGQSTSTSQSNGNTGLRYILGDKFVKGFEKRKLFVVGAGAIGCEVLKNLAAMGAATSSTSKKKGKIILTDMDTIEKSNLSRQLLFRDSDLGKFKSVAAEHAAKMFNDKCVLDVHSSKVGDGDSVSSAFDENFWAQEVDIVLNALDNVDARMYMDGQCVKYHKALVDAGTMGPKGNVQVVVPKQSESYASSADPPDEDIPVCTLKNFPYAIAHTIQWARDLFGGVFVQRAQQVNDFMESLEMSSSDDHSDSILHLAEKMLHEAGEEAALSTAEELAEDLQTVGDLSVKSESGKDVEEIRSQSLQWAVSLAKKLYVESVDMLLKQHPLNSKDEDGDDFWSGTRRPPSRLYYGGEWSKDPEQELMNENLISFVRHGARLRAETFLSLEQNTLFSDQEAIEALAASSLFLGSDASDVCVDESVENSSKQERVVQALSKIPMDRIRSKQSTNLHMADFEKDDESNGHVAFITAASNLRAISYGIPPVDAMETRRVAGKIIPAMITTTAFVSALSCLELVKVVQKAPLQSHRNAFINLALPFYAFTAPLPAETTPGLNGKEYTLWDQLSISESMKASEKGRMTVKALLKRIRKLAAADTEEDGSDVNIDSIEVASLSLGPYLLYANFLHEEDKALLKSSIWDAIQEALDSDWDDMSARDDDGDDGGKSISGQDAIFDLTAVVEDVETGEEVELPPIRLRRFQ